VTVTVAVAGTLGEVELVKEVVVLEVVVLDEG
jgi:hypothetical protein